MHPSVRSPYASTAGEAAALLRRAATYLLRYGLVVMIAWFGAFKFTPAEAQAIQPLVANSPLLHWLYGYWTCRAPVGRSALWSC